MDALVKSETTGEFNVWWWAPDGSYYPEKRRCGAKEAVETAISLTCRPAAKLGIVKRVIITDSGDDCTWEWKDGKMVFPIERT